MPAQPIAFTESVLTASAAAVVTVEYLNDSPVPRNIAFYEGSDGGAPQIAATARQTASGARPTMPRQRARSA